MTTAYQRQPSCGRNSSPTLQTATQATLSLDEQSCVVLSGEGAGDADISRDLVGHHPDAVIASQASFGACDGR